MFSATPLLAVLFVLLWNSGFIGAEYALPYAGPFTQTFWRYLILALLLLLFLVLKDRFWWPGWMIVMPTFGIGILAHAVWLSGCLLSIQYGVPAGIVALVVALQPLLTGALSGFVVGEYTPVHRWVGLIIGFSGVAITVLARVDFKETASLLAYLLPLGAAVAMTAAHLIHRRLEVHQPSSVLPVDLALFYQSLAATAALILPAILFENLAAQWQPELIGTMIWLIIAVSLFAYALMFRLLARMDATRVASLFYLGPPATMIMAWAVFGDTLQRMDVVGLVVVFIGVLFAQLQLKDKIVERQHNL